ncbi:MAG: glycosyltransferase family 4 protein, partial [Promicromonosporaceae bacterium]|nr:glycosyltransferase family 4 protein [Promicromonosporaceae bacterium]
MTVSPAPRVLVVTNTPHQPATSGYSLRVTAVVAALEYAGFDVRAYSVRPNQHTPEGGAHRISPNWRARSQVFRDLLRHPALSRFKWFSPRACDDMAKLSATWHPQVVVLESSYLAAYAPLFDCPIVFDLHNVESVLISNFAHNRSGFLGFAARVESWLMRRAEAAIPGKAFAVVTVSDTDRDYLGRDSHARAISAPNGVADEAFAVADEISDSDGPIAVFIAHLGWRPNIDGAKWLAEQVWPQVKAQVPDARLELVGRTPSAEVLALADSGLGVSIHGDVPSVYPYLARAAAATAPLWTAGGTRLKILEALATGTPVVATSLGALGLAHLAAPEVEHQGAP